MKTLLYTIALLSIACLVACGNKNANPMPPYADPRTTGGLTITFKNIIVNNINITYSNNLPGAYQLTNNAGTTIGLSAVANGIGIEIVNENAANGSAANTQNNCVITYPNIISSPDNKQNSDSITNKYPNMVYVRIPVDKSIYGSDEYHAYLNNDGGTNAGQIHIQGNTTAILIGEVDAIFRKTKLVITNTQIQ